MKIPEGGVLVKVRINNWNSIYNENRSHFDVKQAWYSPDKKYAVLEIWTDELFVFGKLIDENEEIISLDYIDSFSGYFLDEVDFRTFWVEWGCMQYGFCKLVCRELESGRMHRAKRFYFDPELYKQKYEEENKVPYKRNKKFHIGYLSKDE